MLHLCHKLCNSLWRNAILLQLLRVCNWQAWNELHCEHTVTGELVKHFRYDHPVPDLRPAKRMFRVGQGALIGHAVAVAATDASQNVSAAVPCHLLTHESSTSRVESATSRLCTCSNTPAYHAANHMHCHLTSMNPGSCDTVACCLLRAQSQVLQADSARLPPQST